MNFFAMDQANSRIVGTRMIWIFIISAAAMTAFTFLFYYWLLHRDGFVFRRLVPKVRLVPDWNIQASKWQQMVNVTRTNTARGDTELHAIGRAAVV